MGSVTSLGNQDAIIERLQRLDGQETLHPGRVQPIAAASSSGEMRYGFSIKCCRPGLTNEISSPSWPADVEISHMAWCSSPKVGGTSAELYMGLSTNLPRTQSGTEFGQATTQEASIPPSWGFAAWSRDTPASLHNPASTEVLSAERSSGIVQQHASQWLNCSDAQPVQPVPSHQGFLNGSRPGTSWESGEGTIGSTQILLLPYHPQRSQIPTAVSGVFDSSHRPYEHEQTWFRMPPSDGIQSTESSLEGLQPLRRQQVAFPQGHKPTWMDGTVLKSRGRLEEASTGIRRTMPTHGHLEKLIPRYLPAFALRGTSFPAHTHATKTATVDTVAQNDGCPSSPKSKRSTSGVQRTERSRPGKLTGTPLFRQRKQHVSCESNVAALQERCRMQGGDDEAVGFLSVIFAEGVDAKALSRNITEEEITKQVFGPSTEQRKVYWALLAQQPEVNFVRYVCRLCPKDKRYPYKNGKDVMPHIRRCHIGIEGGPGKFGGVKITVTNQTYRLLFKGDIL
jgi:hypothetical protein